MRMSLEEKGFLLYFILEWEAYKQACSEGHACDMYMEQMELNTESFEKGQKQAGISGKRGRFFRWILMSFFVAATVTAFAVASAYTHSDADVLILTPIFDDDMGWEICRLDEEGVPVSVTTQELFETEETVYLTRVLDESYEQAGYTFMKLSVASWQISAFLDGKLFFSMAPGAGTSPEETVFPEEFDGFRGAGEFAVTSLPPDYGGRTLTLVCRRSSEYGGMPTIHLSSWNMEDMITISATSAVAMPAAAFMTASLVLLGFWLYGAGCGRMDVRPFLLVLTAVLQALYYLREYGMRFSGGFMLDVPAAALIPSLLILLSVVWLLTQLRRIRWWQIVPVVLSLSVSLAVGFCNVLGVSLPDGFWHTGMWLLLCTIVLVVGYAVRDAVSGGRVARLFLTELWIFAGIVLLGCVGSRALAEYMGNLFVHLSVGFMEFPVHWFGTVLFLLCGVLSLYETVQQLAEDRLQAQMLSVQVTGMLNRIEAVRAAEEALRVERHDMRHRLLLLASLVEKGDRLTALEYIGAARNHLDEVTPVPWCGHLLLDAVFQTYFQQAERKGICVEAGVSLPDKLPVDESELSIVFANALENAIHACTVLPRERRKIMVRCVDKPRFMIQIDNACAGTVRLNRKGVPVAEESGHGCGTRSIIAFCKKNDALWDYRAEEGWFSLRILMQG